MTQVSVNFRNVTAIAAWKVDWEENIVRAGTADKLTSRLAGCPGSVGESQRKGRTDVSTGPSAKNLKPRRGEVSRLGGLADSTLPDRAQRRREPFRKKQTKFLSEPVNPLPPKHTRSGHYGHAPVVARGLRSALMQSLCLLGLVSSQAGGECVVIASFLTGV